MRAAANHRPPMSCCCARSPPVHSVPQPGDLSLGAIKVAITNLAALLTVSVAGYHAFEVWRTEAKDKWRATALAVAALLTSSLAGGADTWISALLAKVPLPVPAAAQAAATCLAVAYLLATAA